MAHGQHAECGNYLISTKSPVPAPARRRSGHGMNLS